MDSIAEPAVRERLRIAIQKSGRLAAPARALLASCGLTWRERDDRLFCQGENVPVDLLLVRDDDIPGLMADGHCDLGIVGRNLLQEQAARSLEDGVAPVSREWRALGFGNCRLSLAVPEDMQWRGPATLAGTCIATSYPATLRAWLREREIAADVMVLSGSVEIAPRLGRADAICDLVSTGATLAANRLRAVEDVLVSEAVLAGPIATLDPAREAIAAQLLRRLDGVLRIRDSRLLVFQAPRQALSRLLPLLTDADVPTVYTVDGSDRIALQALCRGGVTWQRLEALEQAGALGLMVLPVERALA